jgi:hypothetical protein
MLWKHSKAGTGHAIGVIIETETTRPGDGGRIMIRCSDGALIHQEFDTKANLALFPGCLAVIVHGSMGEISLELVNPPQNRWVAYLLIIESGRMVEEFPYRQKVQAEQALQALQAKAPGKFRLEIDKRYEGLPVTSVRGQRE